ncbi:MAG: excinuclease ABC subunit UvrC [Bacteroidetes bacterium]|nr:excinuclease ABC subunit UvrC [Bacteroidota bacterium]
MEDVSLELQLKTLPEQPGVYQYFDKNDTIIYVGKAKNLKKRVNSYFNKNHDNAKTRILVRKIVRLHTIVVETEFDALLLENNLIKKYQPKYNIQLKDDKTYPWICIKNEPFPRVFTTRKLVKDGSKYFGPYAQFRVMSTLMDLFREMYPLRTCSLDLLPSKIEEQRYKVCLEYHIGKCKAPCTGLEKEENYQGYISEIEQILGGNIRPLLSSMKEAMKTNAEAYQFEEAQKIKSRLNVLQNYQSKSQVVSPTINACDVLTVLQDDGTSFFNYLVIKDGAIIHGFTGEIRYKLDETLSELIGFVLPEMRDRFNSLSKEILVQTEIDLSFPEVHFFVPQRGDKKSLIELSLRNATYFRLEKLKQEKIVSPERHTERILNQIQKDFRLPSLPVHIECFDNSNIQGTHPVSACVVFKNAKPSKQDYRHFNVKTVEGPDDFATMEEAVYRRYKRLLDEEQSLPQLLVVDGGKGQLSAALKALDQLGIRQKMVVVGIAKRLEEIFFPGDQYPIYLDKRSESLKVIQHMRNEAHRFGITHHRNRRSKTALQSEILQIEGIGPKTQEILFKNLKSVQGIKNANLEQLSELIGKAKAAIVHHYFQ